MKLRILSLVLLCSIFNAHGMNDKLPLENQMSAYIHDGLKTDQTIKKFKEVINKKGQLKGGGPIGATVGWAVGASSVQLAYHGLSAGIAFVSGPAAPVVMPLWYFWTAAPLVATTKVVALGSAIACGAASGPL